MSEGPRYRFGCEPCGPVLIVFPGSCDGNEVMRVGVQRARETGRHVIAVTVACSPHPAAFLVHSSFICWPWTVDSLRQEMLEEAVDRSRRAVRRVPADISIESEVGSGRPDRVIRELVEKRQVTCVVVDKGWLRQRRMRRAAGEWRAAKVEVLAVEERAALG